MANEFATPTNVMRRVARRLVNECVFAGNVNRSYDPEYKLRGVKQGDTVFARLPQRYIVGKGAVMTPQPITDSTVPITITDQTHVGVEYDTWSATLEVDDYMERYGQPAIDQLINEIDETGLDRMYKTVANTVGTPGVVPGSTGTLPYAANQVYLDAQTKLRETAVPSPYNAVLTPNMHAYLTNANSTLFNPQAAIAAMWKNGQFGGKALGIDKWFLDANTVTHTVGALGGTPLVNGGSQTGSSIICDGAGATAIPDYVLEGDVVQFAGVYEVNPLSRKSTGRLKDFTITADTASIVTTGAITLPISPAIITSGQWQTCSASPANNAAVTVFGHASTYADTVTPQGLVYNKDAFALVMADLILPGGLWVAERVSNKKLAISIRFLKDHDTTNDVSPTRFDTAHGWKNIRPVLACRVCG